MNISVQLVEALIEEQFPQWAHLPVTAVQPGGHDNRTFRLGTELSVRLPSHGRYEAQVAKEARWLPFLAKYLSIPVTVPEAVGRPSQIYPMVWSVNRWLPGRTALEYPTNKETFALDLSKFLHEMWQIPAEKGPLAGEHNFYRGGDIRVYHQETIATLANLGARVDQNSCRRIWEQALTSYWQEQPVWLHGDVAPGNLLVNAQGLTGVIDFGTMGTGDPAADLVMAWTYFDRDSRRIFIKSVDIDSDTWDRARGWALWKALITYDTTPSQQVVSDLTAAFSNK